MALHQIGKMSLKCSMFYVTARVQFAYLDAKGDKQVSAQSDEVRLGEVKAVDPGDLNVPMARRCSCMCLCCRAPTTRRVVGSSTRRVARRSRTTKSNARPSKTISFSSASPSKNQYWNVAGMRQPVLVPASQNQSIAAREIAKIGYR